MDKTLVVVGSIVCMVTVGIGAFGAHLLSDVLQGKAAGWYQTAVQYQSFHGLGILVCALLSPHLGNSARRAGWLMLFGILVFCGSLYMMALGGPRWLGAVTPIGGLSFISAWALLAWAGWRK